MAFAQRECLNPQRIPSFIVEKKVAGSDTFEAIHNPEHSHTTTGLRPLRFIGIQTDYSEAGKGIIPPAAVIEILKQAREAA